MALGEGENFFSREKAERRHRSFPLPQTPTLFKKSGVFCDCSNLPVWPDTQPLTHPLPVRGTSQGGKAAVFTSSLQSASFATSHPLGGVFCKVESSPLLEIIYPYMEQSLKQIFLTAYNILCFSEKTSRLMLFCVVLSGKKRHINPIPGGVFQIFRFDFQAEPGR